MIEKILKILAISFWIFILILMSNWYFSHRKIFFPFASDIQEIHNINPFK